MDFLLKLIFPDICGICKRPAKDGICNKCMLTLKKQAVFGIDDYSQNTEKYFNEHIYLFSYEGLIRNLILKYKFQEKSYLYEVFIKILKNNKKICLFLEKYDIIMPIPISKKRMKQRGYNQSSILAKKIAKETEKQYQEKVLIKIKNNPPQSALNKEERMKNIQNVYNIQNKEKIQNKKILLVDDIYTTGSTVNECSKILIENGAKEIGILTIAKD